MTSMSSACRGVFLPFAPLDPDNDGRRGRDDRTVRCAATSREVVAERWAGRHLLRRSGIRPLATKGHQP